MIRDTYSSSNALQNDKTDSEADESSTSSNNTQTSKRSSKQRSTATHRRELNKLKEYVKNNHSLALTESINALICSLFSLFSRESNLLKRIFQCCLLNGGFFGLSIILFDYVLLPIVRVFLSWMFTRHPGNGAIIGNYIVTFLSILFGMIWVRERMWNWIPPHLAYLLWFHLIFQTGDATLHS